MSFVIEISTFLGVKLETNNETDSEVLSTDTGVELSTCVELIKTEFDVISGVENFDAIKREDLEVSLFCVEFEIGWLESRVADDPKDFLISTGDVNDKEVVWSEMSGKAVPKVVGFGRETKIDPSIVLFEDVSGNDLNIVSLEGNCSIGLSSGGETKSSAVSFKKVFVDIPGVERKSEGGSKVTLFGRVTKFGSGVVWLNGSNIVLFESMLEMFKAISDDIVRFSHCFNNGSKLPLGHDAIWSVRSRKHLMKSGDISRPGYWFGSFSRPLQLGCMKWHSVKLEESNIVW